MMCRQLLPKLAYCIVLLLVAAALYGVEPVYAIPITPDKYFFDISQDTVIEDRLLIMGRDNIEDREILYITPVGMRKYGEEHERDFYLPNPDDPSEPANWIKVSNSKISISAGEEVYIDWVLIPTKYAGCGTNLAAIMVSDYPITEESPEDIFLHKNVVSQIHLNILQTDEGICDENVVDLELLEFRVDTQFSIFNYDQVPFITRIENHGNLISRNPQGYIDISGLGDKITLEFNPDNLDIYPGTVRRFSDIWIDPDYPRNGSLLDQFLYEISHLRFGRYEARLGITKNVDPPIIETVYFWVLPWKVIIVILSIVILLFSVRKVNKLKTSKRSPDKR